MALQVTIQICTEDTKIRLATTIHKDGVIDMMFFIILLNHLFRLFNIVCQELYLAILRQHFRRTEPHTVHIDIDRTFDTASATLLHTTPVLERVAYEQVRRNSSDGFVEITNLHCIQWHFYYITVRSILRHSDPVAYFQHIVGRKLHTGNKAHDTVFEY